MRHHAGPCHLPQRCAGPGAVGRAHLHAVEVIDRFGYFAEHVAEQAVIRLAAQVRQDGAKESVERVLAVSNAVPQALPQHGAQQRIVDRAQVPAGRGERTLVQHHLDETPVLVIRVDQVRTGAARHVRHRGGFTLVGDGDILVQRELAILEYEAGHLHPLFAQQRQGGKRGALAQGEAGYLAGHAAVVGLDSIDARLVQPLARPGRQVAPSRFAQRAEKVLQPRILVLVLDQVVVHALAKHLCAEQVAQLLQGGCAFRIGDRIDVVEGVRGRRHRHLDRVRGRTLVLDVGALFGAAVETLPCVLEFGRFGRGHGRHEGGEALVEPQSVPPVHGDQVAEPLVRHLVQDGLGHALALARCHGRLEDEIALGEGDCRCVFHGAVQEVGHQDLVVFAELVGNAVITVEVLQAFAREAEPVRRR